MNLQHYLERKDMSKSRVLLLFTNHRVAEKLWPIIPMLADKYIVDLFMIGLMSYETPWIGDIDEREIMVNKYNKYLDKIINGPGIKYHGDVISADLSSYIDINMYSKVIFDDNRSMSEYNIPALYQECNDKNIMVIGNSHGNEDTPHDALGVSYDVKMDFKTGGIPANDTLKSVVRRNNHILLIANFLGNRSSPYSVNLDQRFINETGIVEISNHYNLPIIVKIKTRLDNPDYRASVKYVNSLLKCSVVANTDNIDQLIADSALVLSAPSTLAFKPIQLGIPTILIKGSGAIGCYKDYYGLVNLNRVEIFKNLTEQVMHGKYKEFIDNNIAGGVTFTSAEQYIKCLEEIV